MRTAARPSAPGTGRPRRATLTSPIVTSTRSASSAAPAVPAAHTKRPQFGSPPWKAALQSVDSATARATRRASPPERAPRTRTSTTRVPPSPSSTTRRAISSSTAVTARVRAACCREPRAIGVFAAAPLASSSTVSFVLMSPSTVMALSVASTASPSVARSTRAGAAASVTTKTRSVARSGAIMPAPLPSAATVTRLPPSTSARRAVFGNASVVVMASAACGKPAGASAAAAARTPARSRCRGTWTPIRPVAHGTTSAGARPRSRAASAVASAAVRRPSAPVQALALPAWTRTAEARPAATRRRASWTGAAGARLVVNTPATLAGRSATIRATSRPRCLRPARTPEKRNPGTRTRCARRWSFIRRGSRLPVALLVLLAAPARARIVAPDLGSLAADRLDLLRLLRPVLAVGERHARGRPLAPLHPLDLRGQGGDVAVGMLDRHPRPRARGLGPELHAHQLLDHVGLEATHHPLAHVVAFLLVGLEGLDLPVAAQPDALLQVVHAEEVVLPEGVERLEHDELLEVAHDRRPELLLAPLVGLAHLLDEDVLEPFQTESRPLRLREVGPEVELGEAGVVERLPAPLLRGRVGVAVRRDEVLRQPLGHLEHILLEVVAPEQVPPARVDDLALLVEDVVVLEEMLADVEVVGLDLLLRVADGAGDQAMLDRHALFHPEPLHEPLHAVGAEDAQEVVLEREVEAGRARVALPAAAAAELVVNPARFVPLGAEDVEAARGHHLLVLGSTDLAVLLEDLLVTRLVLLRRLLELLADLLDALDVLPPALLVALLGGAQRLLVRPPLLLVQALGFDVGVLRPAVARAELRQVAVPGGAALHEQRELEGGEAPLVLGAALVELARRVVGAVADLLPGVEHGAVPGLQLLEARALGGHRRPAAGAQQRRLELALDPQVAGRDGVVVAHGGDELHRAHLLEAGAQRPVGRELEDLAVHLGELAQRLATPLLEVGQLLAVLVTCPLHLLVVALAKPAQRILIALVRLPALLERPGAPHPLVLHLGACQELGVPAEQDVRPAAGHVGGDRDLLEAAGLGDDVRLGLVVDGVQHVVLDAVLLEELRDALGLLDRGGADEHGLPLLVALLDLLDDGGELLPLALVDDVRQVGAPHRLVRRHDDDVELVDVLELDRLGVGRARHATELRVHPEVVLDGDRRERLVLALDPDALLRLHRLVQPVRPAPAGHEPAGELVDDDHLAVLHHVVDVALEERVRLERLGHVVQRVDLARVVEVGDAEEPLALGHALLGERRRAVLLVDRVVDVVAQLRDEPVDEEVLVGRLLGRTRDDERRARLVDQDVVHLVDDRVVQLALDVLVQAELHVVAQVVEAELVVGAVGDVGAVGVAPVDRPRVEDAVVLGDVGQVELEAGIVDDRRDREAEELVDRPHPLDVAARQVVVDGDEMSALGDQGVQVEGQRGDERLPLPRLHLGDLALVQHDPAEELDVEVAQPDRPPRRLAHGGEGLGEDLFERRRRILGLDPGEALAEARGLLGEGLVGQRAEALLEPVDLFDDGPEPAQRALVRAAKEARQEAWHQGRAILVTALGDVKLNARCGRPTRSGCRGSGARSG